jgi:MerR family mercuric resistance operon transcriptional regulator
LLDLADQKSRSCRRVHDIAAEHLAEVRMKIADQTHGALLGTMVKTCAQGTMPTCPLLETLALDAAANPRPFVQVGALKP